MSGEGGGFFTPDSLAAAMRGRWLTAPGSPASAHGASIDTRTLANGQVFFAIRGDHGDGHEYLAQAVERGAYAAVVERKPAVNVDGSMGVLLVSSTRSALLDLARASRAWLDAQPHRPRIIAVGGSNGKTTTTRLIEAILASGLTGAASPKSFNNFLGVPLTVLSARPEHQYLICEIGTNAPGEVDALASIVRPDIAVITSIGREHLEGLGSIEGVASEQASIVHHLTDGGVAIVPADGPARRALLPRLRNHPRVETFGVADDATHRTCDVRTTREGTTFTLHDTPLRVKLLGAHNALNAAAAAIVARHLDLDWPSIAEALATAVGPEMRMMPRTIAGAEIINDAYNANPDSMLAAIRAFADFARHARRRVVILGQMLELGPASAAAHEEVAFALLSRADRIVLIGHGFHAAADLLARRGEQVRWLVDLDDGRAADVAAMIEPGDAVLLKGSRRMGVERVADALGQIARTQARP